jgi:hypothetical protein
MRKTRLSAVFPVCLLFLHCSYMYLAQKAYEESYTEPNCIDTAYSGPFLVKQKGGQREFSCFINKNRLNGEFISYAFSSETLGIIHFNNGSINGDIELWYHPETVSKKTLKLRCSYVSDTLDGEKTSWYSNGALRAKYVYKMGRLISAKATDIYGKQLSDIDAIHQAYEDKRLDTHLYAEWVRSLQGKIKKCT